MMTEILTFLNHFNQTALNWFMPFADGALKGCMILALLWLFLKLGRRLRPPTRHLILFIGMVSILLVPVVTYGITFLNGLQPADSLKVGNSLSHRPVSSANPPWMIPDPFIQLARISDTRQLGVQLPHWSMWLLLLWITGLLISGGKWLVENIRVCRQIRTASPAQDPEWAGLLDDLKAATGITLPVQLRFSSTVSFPLVFGWLRPVILLPESAGEWPVDRRQVILLHELSHVQRYDNLSQLLASVTAIVYWFNPLVWAALRLLKTNRELACDDRVLESGVLPSVYAAHLFAVIQSIRANSLKLKSVAAMTAPKLEQRMVNILTKHDQSRKSLTKSNLIGLVLTALLIMAVGSLGNVIGFAADNPPADPSGNNIQNPQVSIQGGQLEIDLQVTKLQGPIQEFPTLWPEKGIKSRINSPFGSRIHPVLKKEKFHSGIDIGSPMGTPIVAAADGEVVYAGWKDGYGNYIEINHQYLTSIYSKLNQILVHSGDKVQRGAIIAYSGKTGIATGPHLHYEIRYGELPINPEALAGLSQ